MKQIIFILFLLIPYIFYGQKKDSFWIRQPTIYRGEPCNLTLEKLNELIQLDSNEAAYYDCRGDVYFGLRNIKKSIEDYTRAIQIEPNNPYTYEHRASVYYSIQKPDFAIIDDNLALTYIDSDDTLKYEIINNRGNAKAMKRDFQGAYDDYIQVLFFDSTSIGALLGLGAVLDDLNRVDDAIMYLQKALNLYPDDPSLYGNLAFRYMDKGDFKKALELSEKVLALAPEDALGLNNRGFVKYKLKDFAGALNDINKSLQLYPENSFAYKNRGLVYIGENKIREACINLHKAVDLGFTEVYGDEVQNLINKYCKKH